MFKKKRRIKKTEEIKVLFTQGKNLKGKFLALRYLPNQKNFPRLIFIVSLKNFPKAIQRNQVRRFLRSFFLSRRNQFEKKFLDILVITIKPFNLKKDRELITQELERLINQIS